MEAPNPKEPNPKDIKEEKFDWEEHERRYPKQTHKCVERKTPRPADGLLLKVGQCINDIPLDQRHRYMWVVSDEMKDHPCYKEKDYGGRIIREDKERVQKEKDDKKKKEEDREKKEEDRDRRERDREKNDKDKDDKIEMLLKYVADLGKQVNELTKQMKK